MGTVFRGRPTSSDSCWRRWKIEHEDGVTKLVVDWMDVKAAPEAILELLACNCTKKCVTPKRLCHKWPKVH